MAHAHSYDADVYDANAAWTADYNVPTLSHSAFGHGFRPNALMISLAAFVVALTGTTVSIASNFAHIPDIGAEGTPGESVGYIASKDVAAPEGPRPLLVTLEPQIYPQGASPVTSAAVRAKGEATFTQAELASMAADQASGQDAATETDNARHIDTAEDVAVDATDATVPETDDSTAATTADAYAQ